MGTLPTLYATTGADVESGTTEPAGCGRSGAHPSASRPLRSRTMRLRRRTCGTRANDWPTSSSTCSDAVTYATIHLLVHSSTCTEKIATTMGNRSSSANDNRPPVPDNWNASGIPTQKGRTVIVTGANSGIGFETALELARNGADVVLACRNEGRGKEAEQKLREALNSTADAGSVEFKMLDVSDLGSVNKFADEFKATHDRLDLLINNAGVMAVPYAKTVDGYERQFATNHLGHFVLTAQLFPLLRQSAPSRVVNVSSLAHLSAKLEPFTTGPRIMRSDDKGYSASEVYAESKLCNLLFTFELTRRLKAQNVSGVTSVVAHPGFTATNLMGPPSSEGGWLSRLLWRVGGLLPVLQDAPTGALPTLYAATALDVESDDYYGPDNYFEIWGPPKRVQAKATAHDKVAAQNLWEESERLAKVKFDVQ
ncbi:hypothetical protein PF008_g6474 [Phytophthora fragariae]|uniref:Short-chain dehydrogenase TIC 32 n=1 Tax=Phytophthora fragariae TaxID=53985 RepID=A0A6G0S751_9STRA|nr:hypothetical protein PF008_g6474 [Phytophthora fragariae]